MWAVLLGLLLVLSSAGPVSADSGLTNAVAAAYFPRTVDEGLHAIAHQRVLEISACPTCLNHSLMRAGTAEVLAYNWGSSDPIGNAVASWRASPVHNAILSDASLGRIGCAQVVASGTSYFACVLAAGALPAPAPAAGTGGSGGGGATGGGGGSGGGALAGMLPDTAVSPAGD